MPFLSLSNLSPHLLLPLTHLYLLRSLSRLPLSVAIRCPLLFTMITELLVCQLRHVYPSVCLGIFTLSEQLCCHKGFLQWIWYINSINITPVGWYVLLHFRTGWSCSEINLKYHPNSNIPTTQFCDNSMLMQVLASL